MPFYGFYSPWQAQKQYMEYTTPKGSRVYVSEVIKTRDLKEAHNYFLLIYKKRVPDGVWVGEVSKIIRLF